MRALLRHTAIIEHDNLISSRHSRQAVRDDKCRAVLRGRVERNLNVALCRIV